MSADVRKETLVESKVTYTLEINGRFFIVENVPARLCEETGEQLFSSETVERLQQDHPRSAPTKANYRNAGLRVRGIDRTPQRLARIVDVDLA